MTYPRFSNPAKIVNPELARIFLRGDEAHGAFKAFVRFALPDNYPSYMKVMKLHSPGLFTVSIPCDQIEKAADDDNILSIELREYTSGQMQG